ncbi:MAG: hypothetical protein NVS1B14_01380 [Vulcanimicrobiaceae bacterium]
MAALTNPWAREEVSAEQAVLLALSIQPQTVNAIAVKSELPEDRVRAALEPLTQAGLAIPENEEYELSGPLSWFGTFEAAVNYYAQRHFLVAAAGVTHLYLIHVRVKGVRPMGDALTETLAVFACGQTAGHIAATSSQTATCEDCRRVAEHA